VVRVAGVEQAGATPDPKPGKVAPVLRPAIDEKVDVGPRTDVADAFEVAGIGNALRLLVERGDEARTGGEVEDHETDRDESRGTAVRGARGKRGRPRFLEEPPLGAGQDGLGRHVAMMHASAVPPPTPPTRHVTTTRIVAVRGSSLEYRADRVVGEEPLEIRAAGPGQEPVAVAVTMRTPGNEAELAIGFLRTEGLIEGPEVIRVDSGDPADMNQPDDQATVRLARAFDASRVAERHFVATASCGICGKASIDEVAIRTAPIPPGPVIGRRVLLALPDLLRAAQRAFDETGGLHAAGLFTPSGELLSLREDVGRHNALDKVVGSQVLAKALPLNDRVLVVSGRVSFEIVQKAAVVGIPVICAVSAPSDLAIETADRLGVTLVGFLRGDGFNVYSHDERIDLRDLLGMA
jgi:FdhD protein